MKKLIIIVICLFSIQCEKGWLNELIISKIEGCKDPTACNYSAEAEEHDFNCIYTEVNFDCDGNCLLTLDINGDCCSENKKDCSNVCDGTAYLGSYYPDNDGDGWGHNLSSSTEHCSSNVLDGLVLNNNDIDDNCYCLVNDTTCDCIDDQTDCTNPDICSNCTDCESSCCPNYCSGNYYYYNRTCSNEFCIGATSDYCENGCNENGCN